MVNLKQDTPLIVRGLEKILEVDLSKEVKVNVFNENSLNKPEYLYGEIIAESGYVKLLPTLGKVSGKKGGMKSTLVVIPNEVKRITAHIPSEVNTQDSRYGLTNLDKVAGVNIDITVEFDDGTLGVMRSKKSYLKMYIAKAFRNSTIKGVTYGKYEVTYEIDAKVLLCLGKLYFLDKNLENDYDELEKEIHEISAQIGNIVEEINVTKELETELQERIPYINSQNGDIIVKLTSGTKTVLKLKDGKYGYETSVANLIGVYRYNGKSFTYSIMDIGKYRSPNKKKRIYIDLTKLKNNLRELDNLYTVLSTSEWMYHRREDLIYQFEQILIKDWDEDIKDFYIANKLRLARRVYVISMLDDLYTNPIKEALKNGGKYELENSIESLTNVQNAISKLYTQGYLTIKGYKTIYTDTEMNESLIDLKYTDLVQDLISTTVYSEYGEIEEGYKEHESLKYILPVFKKNVGNIKKNQIIQNLEGNTYEITYPKNLMGVLFTDEEYEQDTKVKFLGIV